MDRRVMPSTVLCKHIPSTYPEALWIFTNVFQRGSERRGIQYGRSKGEICS